MRGKEGKFKLTSQEHAMGCAVACVASLCRIKYQEALRLFQNQESAWTRGFYCSEIVEALESQGLTYSYDKFLSSKHGLEIKKPGTIIFVDPCLRYPSGHFFLRIHDGWMNPWSNFPSMKPVKSAVEKRLPGKISYLVFAKDEIFM